MAVLQKFRELFITEEYRLTGEITPAPPASYSVRALSEQRLEEVVLLNLRCFRRGENYTKYTFRYLLSDPRILSYQAVTGDDSMVGFIFIVAGNDHIAHITTIGVAPEHRKRGIARLLLEKAEQTLSERDFDSIVLEVRVSNVAAQNLYINAGYMILQRLQEYYSNGEDGYLMSKVVPVRDQTGESRMEPETPEAA